MVELNQQFKTSGDQRLASLGPRTINFRPLVYLYFDSVHWRFKSRSGSHRTYVKRRRGTDAQKIYISDPKETRRRLTLVLCGKSLGTLFSSFSSFFFVTGWQIKSSLQLYFVISMMLGWLWCLNGMETCVKMNTIKPSDIETLNNMQTKQINVTIWSLIF